MNKFKVVFGHIYVRKQTLQLRGGKSKNYLKHTGKIMFPSREHENSSFFD